MVWYNNLFGARKKVDREITDNELYCGNPQCSDPVIKDEVMLYNEKDREIYHSVDYGNECFMMANAHKALNSSKVVASAVHVITREKANDLLTEGKIIKPSNLEDRL